MTSKEFVDLVAEMREVQRAWFGGDKSSATLGRSKELERRVDRAVKEMRDDRPSLFPDDAPAGKAVARG